MNNAKTTKRMGDENIKGKLCEKNGIVHFVDSIMQPIHWLSDSDFCICIQIQAKHIE